MNTLLTKIESFRPFTDTEAWNLFRLAAFGEAIGWTLLIIGISIQQLHWPYYDFAVPIAGQVHGTLFVVYFGILAATYSSLRWPRTTAILAIAAGVPPYGSLAFEQWQAHRRRRDLMRETFRRVVVSALIIRDQDLLAIQPADRVAWALPGGPVQEGEDPSQAVARLLYEQTGLRSSSASLRYVQTTSTKNAQTLEFIFHVTSNDEDQAPAIPARSQTMIDDIRFIAHDHKDLHPMFLRHEPLSRLTGKDHPAVIFLPKT